MRTRPRDGERPASTSETDAGARLRRDMSTAPEAFLYCLKVFLAVRLALWALAMIAVAVLPHAPVGGADSGFGGFIPGPVGVPGWPAHPITPGWSNLFTSFERFDALWYLRIAAGGYRAHDGSAAFYPLFPLAVRAVSFVIGGHPLAAGLIVSNGAFLAALFVLYVLTRAEFSEDTARAAVLFTAVLPTSFFFFAPYSESLFLLLVLLAFLGARRRRWVLAGVTGALAALTRNVGVLVALPLAVEAVHQWRERPGGEGRPLVGFVSAAGPLVGVGAYLWYWHHRIGDWFAPIRVQNGWQRVFASPISTIGKGTKLAFQYLGIYPGGYHLLDWLIAIPVLCLAAYVVVRYRPAYAVYVWASILPPLAFVFESRPFMSLPRFALPLFPLSWALARLTERSRVRRELAIAISASALGFLLLLFVNWYYIF